MHCYCVTVAITGDSADNVSFLMDDSLSHLFITSNELSVKEETKENPLGVLSF